MKCNTKGLYILILISGLYLYGQNNSIPTIAVLNLENQDFSGLLYCFNAQDTNYKIRFTFI